MADFDDTRKDAGDQGTRPRDASSPSASDSFRQEAYARTQRAGYEVPQQPPQSGGDYLPGGSGPMDGSDSLGRRTSSSVLSENFDNPVSHLERARDLLRSQGMRGAEREFFQAVRAADNIDQREVAQQRAAVARELQTTSDAARKRELVQWDETLHDMQRAPGFTRANLAMAYIRMGMQSEGARLLMEAARLDPEMEKDPNFMRHMRSLDRFQASPGAGGQFSDNPAARTPARPGQPGSDRPQSTAPAELPSGTLRPDAPGFDQDNPIKHLVQAKTAFDQGKQLTPQIRAEYEKAIQQGDNLDRGWIAQKAKDLQDQLKQTYPAESQQRVKTLVQERDTITNGLDSNKKGQLDALRTRLEQAQTNTDRDAIKAQMRTLVPDAAAKQDEIDRLTAQPKAILSTLKQLDGLNNTSSLARFAYADALRTTGNADDTAKAKTLLQQALTLDPNAAQDKDFQATAKAVGLQIADTPARPADAPARPAGAPADGSDRPVAVTPAGAKQGEEFYDYLKKAHEAESGPGGFSAAKPFYDKAVQAADAVNQQEVTDQLKRLNDLKNQPGVTDDQKKLYDQGIVGWTQYQHAPFTARFQYGIAQNNAGDAAGAKATLDQAKAKDGVAANDPAIAAVLDMVNKGQKTTPDAIQAAVAKATAPDDPQTHLSQFDKLFKEGNKASAIDELKKAIAATDKLPMDQFQAALAKVQADKAALAADTTKDQAQKAIDSQVLVEREKAIKTVMDAPANLRLQLAAVYAGADNQHPGILKPEEAKAAMDEATTKNPGLKDDPRYKAFQEWYAQNNKGTLEKAKDFVGRAWKDIVSDAGAGTAGLAVMALFPERRLLGLGLGLVAGGGTKYALNKAMGAEDQGFWSNMGWGAVDVAAFAAGAGVRSKLMTGLEKDMTGEALSRMLVKQGVKDTELAALKGMSVQDLQAIAFQQNLKKLDGLGNDALIKMITSSGAKDVDLASLKAMSIDDLRATAAKQGLKGVEGMSQEALAKMLVDGQVNSRLKGMSTDELARLAEQQGYNAEQVKALQGMKGFEGLKSATQMLEKNIAEQRSAGLKDAIAQRWADKDAAYATKYGDYKFNWRKPWEAVAPAWESTGWRKGLYEAGAKTPLVWRAMTPEVKAVASNYYERAGLPILNVKYGGIWKGFQNPETFTTLNDLNARSFWQHAKTDFATTATSGLVYRGAHNVAKIGDTDQETGQKYSYGDALLDTAYGSLQDGVAGASLMMLGRQFSGVFTRHGVTNPLTPPVRPAALGEDASLAAKALQGGKYAWYGAKYAKYGVADWAPTKVGQGVGYVGDKIAASPKLSGFVGAVPTGATVFSPKLFEGYAAHKQYGVLDDRLADLQAPIQDKPIAQTPNANKADAAGAGAAKPEGNASANQPDAGATQPAQDMPAEVPDAVTAPMDGGTPSGGTPADKPAEKKNDGSGAGTLPE